MPSWKEFEELVKSVNTEEEFEDLKLSTDFIAKLIKARLDKNLTQAELAVRAGLKQSAIARIENQGCLPRIDTLLKIAQALDMELSFFPKNTQRDDLIEKLTSKIDNLENLIKELITNNLKKQNNRDIIVLNEGDWSNVSVYKPKPLKDYPLSYNNALRGDGRYEEEYQ